MSCAPFATGVRCPQAGPEGGIGAQRSARTNTVLRSVCRVTPSDYCQHPSRGRRWTDVKKRHLQRLVNSSEGATKGKTAHFLSLQDPSSGPSIPVPSQGPLPTRCPRRAHRKPPIDMRKWPRAPGLPNAEPPYTPSDTPSSGKANAAHVSGEGSGEGALSDCRNWAAHGGTGRVRAGAITAPPHSALIPRPTARVCPATARRGRKRARAGGGGVVVSLFQTPPLQGSRDGDPRRAGGEVGGGGPEAPQHM